MALVPGRQLVDHIVEFSRHLKGSLAPDTEFPSLHSSNLRLSSHLLSNSSTITMLKGPQQLRQARLIGRASSQTLGSFRALVSFQFRQRRRRRQQLQTGSGLECEESEKLLTTQGFHQTGSSPRSVLEQSHSSVSHKFLYVRSNRSRYCLILPVARLLLQMCLGESRPARRPRDRQPREAA